MHAMRPVFVSVLLFLACGSPASTFAGSWSKRARDAIVAMPWVTVADVESPCRLAVKKKSGETVSVRLKGIAPIPLDNNLTQTQAVHNVAEYIYGLTNSHSFLIILEDQEEQTGSHRLGTLLDPGWDQTLQELLVREGYARPIQGASRAMWKSYEHAKKEKKGIWALLDEKKKGHNKMNRQRP